jgi:hypothetical protein
MAGTKSMGGNSMKVIMVEPNKPARIAEIGDSLRDLQRAVGGHIEAIYPYEELVAIVANDEGKIDGLPLNRALRDENGDIYDIISGSFFICGIGEDDFKSIPDDLAEKFLGLFREPETFMRVGGKIIALKIK